jgi:hypothetical protein
MVYNEAMPPDQPQQPYPPYQPPQPPVQPPLPPAPPQPTQSPPTGPHAPEYDFIMDPKKTSKGPLLPSFNSSSLITRVGVIAGGLLVLLILFALIKSLLFKGPDLSAYVTIAQDQQELIHLTSTASSQFLTLSSSNKNMAATINITLLSNQNQILTYLAGNHHKVSTKTLNKGIDANLDTQLTNAQAAGTYDASFQSVVEDRLNAYLNDLSRTYQASSGQKGRAILKSDYAQGVLLLNQAKSSTSAPS